MTNEPEPNRVAVRLTGKNHNLTAHCGPVTLQLSPGTMEWLGEEWRKRGTSLTFDEVVSDVLNRTADQARLLRLMERDQKP